MQLHIPTPCHEDWTGMSPAGAGRHCSACAKTVVDFTAMSDAEVVAYVQRSSDEVCGRVRNTQLDRPLNTPSRPSPWFGRAIRAGLAATGLAAATTALPAQVRTLGLIAPSQRTPTLSLPKPEPQQVKRDTLPKPGKDSTPKTQAFEPRMIRGIVTDTAREILMGANILLVGTEPGSVQSTTTDIDGRFEILVPAGIDSLQFSYYGFAAQTLPVPLDEDGTIVLLSELPLVLMGGIGVQRELPAQSLDWPGGYLLNDSPPRIGHSFQDLLSAPDGNMTEEAQLLLVDHEEVVNPTHFYPNPSLGRSTLSFATLPTASALVNVYNATGQLVWSKPVPPEAQQLDIDLGASGTAGTYVVELLGTKGQVSTSVIWVVE